MSQLGNCPTPRFVFALVQLALLLLHLIRVLVGSTALCNQITFGISGMHLLAQALLGVPFLDW